jgi:hypothetical protein
MSYYDKPKSDSIIYNDDNYISPGESTGNSDNIDLSAYLRKTGDIMVGPLSVPSVSIYSSGNLEFQTTTGNKILTKDHVIDIENNKYKLTNISYTPNDTIIKKNLNVSKIVFPNLTEQVQAFTDSNVNALTNNTYKLTQINYDNGLMSTNFNNNVSINNLVCNNFNTSHLIGTVTNIQNQIDLKQNIINNSSKLDSLLIGTGVISNTIFNYLSNVTSDIQSQFNLKQSVINTSSRLDSLLIGTGVISNTVFNYLTGLTSNIQTQLTSKQATITSTNKISAQLIGNGNITNSILNYLSNVTSDIQTQLNATNGKISTITVYDNITSVSGVLENYNFWTQAITFIDSTLQSTAFNDYYKLAIDNYILNNTTNNLLYSNNSSFTGLETNAATFNVSSTFTKHIDPSTSTKIIKNSFYSVSGVLLVPNLKFAQSLTFNIRLKSNGALISESINTNSRSYFEYNGTNNSEFRTVSLPYSEFIFKADNNYTNITVEYYIIHNVDNINAEIVQFHTSMNLKRLY